VLFSPGVAEAATAQICATVPYRLVQPLDERVLASLSVAASPAKVKARSLVAWMAGRRETEFLKPIDNVILGTAASHRTVAQANTEVAPKVRNPGGRICNRRVKAA
jgi:hypothetical protein